jgi:DNA-binding transcriptional LysR family regulator
MKNNSYKNDDSLKLYDSPFRREYIAFFVTAQKGSFVKASEVLGIQQAGLSKMIKKLEDELGEKLFIRMPSGVKLSSYGEILHCSLSETSSHWNSHLKNQTELTLDRVQKFRVGAHSTVASIYFPRFLLPILESHPQIEIEFKNLTSLEITQKVAELELDFGIVVNPIKNADLVTRHFATDYVRLWKKNVYEKSNLLFYNPEMYQAHKILKKFSKYKLIALQDYETLAKVVSSGNCLGLLPDSIAIPHNLKSASAALLSAQLAFIWHRDRSRVDAFQQLVKKIITWTSPN